MPPANRGFTATGDMNGFAEEASLRCLPSTLNALSYQRFCFGNLTLGCRLKLNFSSYLNLDNELLSSYCEILVCGSVLYVEIFGLSEANDGVPG